MPKADDNPLARVIELDKSSFKRGIALGICGALLVHAAAAAEAARIANGLGGWAMETRSNIGAYLSQLYDVQLVNPPPPPPPPPPEEKPPEPEAPKPVAATAKQVKDEPAPAPAQAGKILTREPDPNEPVDLTGQGFVTGNAETYAGGVTASQGTSRAPVRDLNATPGGVPGGTGTKAGPARSAVDLSRDAVPLEKDWRCPFPPEADADQIDFKRVPIIVNLRADGTVGDAKVVSDPGSGFGRAARLCALSQRFSPRLDREGHPIPTSSRINITFER